MNKFLLAILLLSASAFIAAESFSPLDSKTENFLISTDDCSSLFDSCNNIVGDIDNDSFVFEFILFTLGIESNATSLFLHQDNNTALLFEYSLIPRAPPFI